MSNEFRMPIQVVEAPGATAWLVEDHSVPVVSIAWAWGGGGALDERAGTLSVASALLTEGAGDLDNVAFADALRDEAIGLSFDAQRDGFKGGVRALAPALPEAVRLANLAMRAPRLEGPAFARVRARALAGARAQQETPRGQASLAFWPAAFPNHPAGRPNGGTVESLEGMTPEHARAALARQLRREGVLFAAAGAITPAELARTIPALLEGLPPGSPPAAPPLPEFRRFGQQVVEVAAPQSTLVFGQPGIPVDHPDWEALQVVLRVLAGGGFTSRLMEAVRVQRGLTYGISGGLDVLFSRAIVTGGFATENARVAEALGVVRAEWARMAAEGPMQAELDDAVAFLTGNLPLQFTDSRRIAGLLLGLRRNNRPIAWLEGRAERLRALTREGVAAVAARHLSAEALSFTIAGQPTGL